MARESIFTLEATPIKFGPGAVDDAGWELSRLGVTRALLVTDPGIPHVERVARVVRGAGIEVVVFDGSRVEPTLDVAAGGRRLRAGRARSTGSCRSAAARRSTPRRSRT